MRAALEYRGDLGGERLNPPRVVPKRMRAAIEGSLGLGGEC